MPNAFVHLHPELEAAVRRSLVLTSTERLRRNLIRAFNDAQVTAGRKAWPTPRVQTIGGYLGILHNRLRLSDPSLPQLLGVEAEYELFRVTAPSGGLALVTLAQQAWSLCRQWGIPISSAGFQSTENGRMFADWCDRISRRLQAMNAVTRAGLPDLPLLASDESEIVCFAFEQIPTSYEDWLRRQAGCQVTRLDSCSPPERTPSLGRTSFDSSAQELSIVAQWARKQLEENSDDLRIGIVVPDLASRQAEVLRQFTAELDPLLETGTQGLVDIGGGTSLKDQPIWQPARDWLSLCFEQLSAERARRSMNSPYLKLPGLPALPRNLPPVLDLPMLTRHLDSAEIDPQMESGVRAARREPRSLPIWLQVFFSTLDLAGWTGSGAGSIQYQAQQELRARLEALGRSTDDRAMTCSEALRQMDQFLASITFAPERAPAPIQIMGYLETTGLDFTHLWVLGLDDSSWPQLPAQNPLVPIHLRRQYAVPRTTPEDETNFARERLEHWARSTDQLMVSHTHHSEESELRPSPLIRSLPELELVEFHPDRPHPGFTHRHAELENLTDRQGSPLEGGRHRGGTGRIRDQAVCPFRGFAIHRLGLVEARQSSGLPDALDRGVLIHEALYRLYENASSDRLERSQLATTHFGQAADQALAMHYGRFPRAFRLRERERVVALLSAWNRLESKRQDVTIESLEVGIQAEFGGIGLNLRIDRMDRLGDALIVIDYKTGRVGHKLTHERLLDPQLPLYALTNEAVEGVLYAEVNEERPRLRGIAAIDLDEANLDAPSGGTWAAQRRLWQTQIDTLTQEIVAGEAAVTPYDTRACQNCHLHALCRVGLHDHVNVSDAPGVES